MNRNGLAEHVADELNLSKIEAGRVVEVVLAGITAALKRGEDVRLVGFGTFTIQERSATTGRNPITGETIAIPEVNTVRFRAGGGLKAAVNRAR